MYHIKYMNNKLGFTLIELLVVISLMLGLVSVSVPIFSAMHVRVQQSELEAQIISSLDLAREYTMAGYLGSSYGVYFDTDKYIFYKGDSYTLRDLDFDRIKEAGNIFDLSTDFVDNDVNFLNIFEGVDEGSINIQNQNNGEIEVISVNSLGFID